MEGVVYLDFAEPQDFFSAASDERSKYQTNLLVAKSNPCYSALTLVPCYQNIC